MELLVTLALLALLAPPLLNLVLMGGKILSTAYRQTVAVNLAREALEWQRSIGYCGLADNFEAEVMGFPDYSRRLEVAVLPTAEPAWPLKTVRVTVSWQEGAQEQKVQLVTWQAWR